MPSRTRTKASREMKENVEIVKKSKQKSDGKVKKTSRKVLADKTNSLSDDNASIDVPVKTTKNVLKKTATNTISVEEIRPRRDRRLPSRFIENQALRNLSNSKNTSEKKHYSVTSQESQTHPQNKNENVQQSSKYVEVKPQSNIEVFTSSRPKRNCRLQSVKEVLAPTKKETSNKHGECKSSPFKTPGSLNSSLIANRPKRIARLPSRFEDHSISPNKFIPVQPCFASTPIIQKSKVRTENKQNDNERQIYNVQTREKENNESNENLKVTERVLTRKGKRNVKNVIEQYFSKLSPTKKMKDLKSPATNGRINNAKNTSNSSKEKTSPDSNNNPKSTLSKKVVSKKSPTQKSQKTKTKTGFAKRMLDKSLSFRVFEDRKEEDKNQDIYEFTYDPKEEPQKKKRKRPVKKRPPKPKTVVFKNNYETYVAKVLESLKTKVCKPELPQNVQKASQNVPKASQNVTSKPKNVPTHPQNVPIQPQNAPTQLQNATIQPQNAPTEPQIVPTVNKDASKKIQIIEDIIIKQASEIPYNITPAEPVNESGKNSVHISNYASINVDDIAADFESIGDEINYSPVHSPQNSPRSKTPDIKESAINHKDPLNLQGDVSFFNEQPVASSSMNVSIRDPIASPWRVEFGNLPIRWQANTYLKPNMTPAVDSSFVNSEETNKKHVYTNMVDDSMPEPPVLKQPTIISFMRECAEKSMKKKRSRSLTPKKSNSSLENGTDFGYQTPKKAKKAHASNSSKDKSCDKENSNSNQEVSNQENNENQEFSNTENNEDSKKNSNTSEEISVKKSKNKDGTFFGFDETGSIDQENVSPKKIRVTRARGLRQKSRTVLQELNALTGPTRAVIQKTKLPSSDLINKLYDQIKSAEEAEIPEKDTKSKKEITNTDNMNDSDDSVHLFEDIEVVHHLKPQRKSYGKAKKVTFRQRSNSDSSTSLVQESMSSDEDSFGDLIFQMPIIRQKKVAKKKPKKKVSKKEKQEVDAWAAGFNSMCKDISDFPLVVE